jgi:hypothetical protein
MVRARPALDLSGHEVDQGDDPLALVRQRAQLVRIAGHMRIVAPQQPEAADALRLGRRLDDRPRRCGRDQQQSAVARRNPREPRPPRPSFPGAISGG